MKKPLLALFLFSKSFSNNIMDNIVILSVSYNDFQKCFVLLTTQQNQFTVNCLPCPILCNDAHPLVFDI